MSDSLPRKIFLGFGFALLVLGVVSGVAYRGAAATVESARWVAHTREVLENVDGLLAQVAAAEAAYRDFVITGRDVALAPLDSAFTRVATIMAKLQVLTADNRNQQARLQEFVVLVAGRLAWIEQVISIRRARGGAAAQQLLLEGRYQVFNAELQRLSGALKGTEEALLATRTEALNAFARRTKQTIIAGALVAALLAVLAVVRISRELAARRRAEQVLRESEERFRLLVDGVKDYAIYMLDPEGHIVSWNAGAERIKGYRAEEILGQEISRFYVPEDVAQGKAKRLLRQAEALGRVEDEGWRVRKDGGRLWANVIITGLRDSRGTLVGFVKVVRDLTERRQRDEDLRRYAAELETANAELDTFAYSVSHDLRAPLRSIDGFSLALLEDNADRLDDTGRAHLQRVRAASRRMATLIDDLLELSRVTRAELRRERVDLTALAQSIAADLQRRDPERAVEFTIASGVVAEGDSHLLEVVLDNLLGNAWKYSGKRARARIEFGVTDDNGQPAYYVRDDGAGFDMAYANKLFGAFQRLHGQQEFEGTGIGLATVQRIVHRHGGRAWAQGVVDGGATFYFTL